MSKNNGGPAFPAYDYQENDFTQTPYSVGAGMTLRDWFAGRALTGLLANPELTLAMKKMKDATNVDPVSFFTSAAIEYSDALIAKLKSQ
jgi:hypothetical protein